MSSEGFELEHQEATMQEQTRAYDRGDEGVWDRGEDHDIYEVKDRTNPAIADLFDAFSALRASLIVRASSVKPNEHNIEYSFESSDRTVQATLWDNEEDSGQTRMEIKVYGGVNATAVFFEGDNVAVREGTVGQIRRRKAKAVPPENLYDEELEIAEKTTRDAMVKLYFNE